MGHVVSVNRVPKSQWVVKDALAFFDPTNMQISICNGISGTALEHIFWHEATHAMLYVMGHDLYANEQFVDTFSGLVHQIITTAEG